MSKIKFDDIEFTKVWLESIKNGKGLNHVVDNINCTKQEASTHATYLRKLLAKHNPPIVFPQQKKPGRAASVSVADLDEIASLFETAEETSGS